ncbi:MAG TPA: gamma-glutamyl-gamma-aminobutyrate hydrolase family protein [Streptosporangiaceae bacterium]
MGRPIIGITGELEAARWGIWIREAVVSPVSYARAVDRAGGAPVVLPAIPAHSVPALIAAFDGLVFADGRDLDPSLYEQEAHEQTDPPDHRRDRFELVLMRAAIDADLPFLAIGRGMHVLNVARGGTLTQHLPDRLGNESHKPDPVKLAAHEVQISAASRIGRALGAGSAQVPGGHHQGINRIGSGLLTVAWTEDQVVEAMELQGHAFGVGVQWHPEEADDLRLFEALIAAASEAGVSRPEPAGSSGINATGENASSAQGAVGQQGTTGQQGATGQQGTTGQQGATGQQGVAEQRQGNGAVNATSRNAKKAARRQAARR